MAIFNPQIPDTNDPNYLGYSHPISQPQADQSMEALFKGVGDVFGTAVKGADLSVKKIIDLKAEEAYKERDEYTEALKFGSTVVAGEIPASAKYGQSTTDPGATTSLTDDKGNILSGEGDTEELPPDLENLPASLDILQGARAGGRISPTQYHGRLAALAKSLRSEFPGYKDYVDKEISRITGVDPANAYIRSMIADINSFAVKKATSDTRTLALLYKNIQLKDAPVHIEAVKAGVPGAETKALIYVNDQLAKKHAYDTKKIEIDTSDLEDKEKSRETTKIFTARVQQEVADSFDTVLNVGGVTPKRVEDAIRSGPLPPTEALKLAQGLSQHMLADKIRMQNLARVGAPGTTVVDRLGGAEPVNAIIEKSFAGRQAVIDYLHKGEIAPAHMLATQNKAMGDQNTNAMLTDPEIGPFMLDIQTMHGMGPAVMNQLAILGLVNDYPMKYKAWVDRGRVGAAVGSPNLDGTPRTLNKTMNEIQQEALKDKSVLTPTIARKFINQVLSITDPKLPDEFKRKQIDYAFGTEGLGLISKIQRDSIDPVSGVATAGQYSLYKELASKNMLDTSYRLGGESWTKHKEWTLGTFAAELFTPAIKELNNIQMSPGMRLRYDNERHEFRIDPKATNMPTFGTPAPMSNISSMGHAQSALDKLNGAIASVAHVHKLEGRDVNSTILSGLIHLGFDPSIANPQGIPEHMVKAIVQEREERKRKEEEQKSRLRAN